MCQGNNHKSGVGKGYHYGGTLFERGQHRKQLKAAGRVFKRAIGYSYQQVVSEYIKVSATKTPSEKVDNTVTTFLNEGSMGSSRTQLKAYLKELGTPSLGYTYLADG
jgi:hypothetical protein